MFQLAGEILNSFVSGKYISKDKDKDFKLSKKEFMKLIDCATKEIWIVAGELNPKFYDDVFLERVREKIKDYNLHIHFLFSKRNSVTKSEAIDIFIEENPLLVEMFKDDVLRKNITMYWANKRPVYHFNIIDNNVLLEDIHKSHSPRDVYIKKGDRQLASEYKEHFNKMIAKNDIVEPFVIEDFAA